MKRIYLSILLVVFGLSAAGCSDDSGGETDDAALGADASHVGDTTPRADASPGGNDASSADISEADAGDAGDAGGVDLGLGACPAAAFANVGADSVESATYYVSTDGDDADDGASIDHAFATVQKGVDALEPGDTLSIAPGEYYGSVRRDQIGADGQTTTIRAQIPGTVLLRGDVPAPEFRPVDRYDFVYVADYDFGPDEGLQVVNERDSLHVLEVAPTISTLEFTPGRFYPDRDAGKLYISTSDRLPASQHHYTLSNIGGPQRDYSLSDTGSHGLYLEHAVGVVIDGLTVTGFNTNRLITNSDDTLQSVWGIFLANARDSVVRNSHAYLNGRGIGTYSDDETSGDNVIEGCVARGNRSQFGRGDTGGITLIKPRRDAVRDSKAFLNDDYGINIRSNAGGSPPAMADRSVIGHSIAWGNSFYDTRIKTGTDHPHQTDHLMALKPEVHTNLHPTHCLFESRNTPDHGSDTIDLFFEPDDVDVHQEFADPDNFDFHLQGTSRFRGAADDGSDRGAYAFEGNILYVSPGGDDANDGLSVQNAFETIGHGVDQLGAGQTLYVLPGTYHEDVEVSVQASADQPAFIKGRGTGQAVIDGKVTAADTSHLTFERINFTGQVSVTGGEAVNFADDRLQGAPIALNATGLDASRVTHSTFSGFDSAAIAATGSTGLFLANNLYDNAQSVAVRLDTSDALSYANYNSYASMARAFQIDDGLCAIDDAAGRIGAHSQQHAPQFVADGSIQALSNPAVFGAGGFDARPFGAYRDQIPHKEIRLDKGLNVHSVSATTANIEWMTNFPTIAELGWGPTEDVEQDDQIGANRFASYSLTGLEPDTTYYIKLKSLHIPDQVDDIDADPVDVDDQMISFTTLAQDEEPTTYYVAADGDDQNAGTTRDNAFGTIQKAANMVNVGDTVIIGAGTYTEKVRIRATGTEDKPILFRAGPGQRVVMDGDRQHFDQAIVVGSKSYLTFDGFQFQDYALNHAFAGWEPRYSADFNLNASDHITVSRCISDGHGTGTGYTERSIVSQSTPYIHMTNCVSISKFGGAIFLTDSPNALIEHNVFMRPLIRAIYTNHSTDLTARKNIFTDAIQLKVDQNISLFYIAGRSDRASIDDNTFQLRISPDQRNLGIGPPTLTDALFADPVFQGQLDLEADGEGSHDFWPDRLVGYYHNNAYNFEIFMATNPQVTAQGHGLEPDKFADGLPN